LKLLKEHKDIAGLAGQVANPTCSTYFFVSKSEGHTDLQ
jgi:hypothetical protein